MKVCSTDLAMGRHFCLPDLWRHRFMKSAVEYSNPYEDVDYNQGDKMFFL
jgi:hypothetical protein